MKAVGCDVYNFAETGEIACCLTANSGETNTAGPKLIVLNDQGGSVMNVSDKACTLRAEEHGHQPVICFEPGIMSRDCSAGNRAYVDLCSTLRAQMGDNQPAICFQLSGDRDNPSVSFSEKAYCIPANPMSDRGQAVCFAIDHVITTGGNCTAQGPCVYRDICPTEKAGGVHAVCYKPGDFYIE